MIEEHCFSKFSTNFQLNSVPVNELAKRLIECWIVTWIIWQHNFCAFSIVLSSIRNHVHELQNCLDLCFENISLRIHCPRSGKEYGTIELFIFVQLVEEPLVCWRYLTDQGRLTRFLLSLLLMPLCNDVMVISSSLYVQCTWNSVWLLIDHS